MKTETIDAAARAAYGMAFLDRPATPPRNAFLDPVADWFVLREQRRDAQASLRLSHRQGKARRPAASSIKLGQKT